MNIAYFHQDVWPLTEGSSVQSYLIYSSLIKRGHSVFTSKHCPFPNAKIGYQNLRDFVAFVRRMDVCLMIIDGQYRQYEWLSLLMRVLGCRVIWYINAPSEEVLRFNWIHRWQYWLMKWCRRISAFGVNQAICVSEPVKKWVKGNLLIKRITIVGNGCDINHFFVQKHRETLLPFIAKNVFVVMWHGDGRWPWQGVDVIYQVACAMAKLDKKVAFILLTKDMWVWPKKTYENLMIIPSVGWDQLPYYLSRADVGLVLYNDQFDGLFYNSSMKLLDYLGMGKPVIASNMGAISKIINHGVNGYLTNNNVDEICRHIITLKESTQLRVDMGTKAREKVVKYFSLNQQIDKIELILMHK
jgi:glycosyltransferase involved in cell wall biosynthesis